MWYFLVIAIVPCCDSTVSNNQLRAVQQDSSVNVSENNLLEALPGFTEKIGLPLIQAGVDSFEYRLWCPNKNGIINLIRIRYFGQAWDISETMIWSHIPEYDFRKDDTINHLLETIVDSTRVRQLNPDISVNRFIDSLQYYNLQEAPSNLEIRRSVLLPTDSWRYTFEMADSKHYRLIEYNCGEATSLEQFHHSVEGLLRFLKRSLNVEFRDCYQRSFDNSN